MLTLSRRIPYEYLAIRQETKQKKQLKTFSCLEVTLKISESTSMRSLSATQPGTIQMGTKVAKENDQP